MDPVLVNKQGVGLQGDNIVILKPPRMLSAADAMEFAAWIVALAQLATETKFADVLARIPE
jgi:hypothetical protein